MRLITLPSGRGGHSAVNVDQITWIEDSKPGTRIHFSSNESLYIEKSIDDLVDELGAFAR